MNKIMSLVFSSRNTQKKKLVLAALRLVNLAGRILLQGLLKFKAFFLLPNCFVIYHQVFLL